MHVPRSCICIGKRKINLDKVFAGQCVGIREVDERIWLVSFMDYDLGFLDQDEGRVEPAPQSLWPGESVNHLSGMICKPCARAGKDLAVQGVCCELVSVFPVSTEEYSETLRLTGVPGGCDVRISRNRQAFVAAPPRALLRTNRENSR